MSTVSGFDNVRLGSSWPACVDVSPISGHECYGVKAVAWAHTFKGDTNFVQIRKHNKEKQIALFSFKFELELDEFWQDSTVLWDSREGRRE